MKNFFLSLTLMLVGTLAFANNDSNVQVLDTELSSSLTENNHFFAKRNGLNSKISLNENSFEFDTTITVHMTATLKDGNQICWTVSFTGSTPEEAAAKVRAYMKAFE